jgi:hypothetical protein
MGRMAGRHGGLGRQKLDAGVPFRTVTTKYYLGLVVNGLSFGKANGHQALWMATFYEETLS